MIRRESDGGEDAVIAWAEERGATHELLIEMPLGTVEDAEGLERSFTLVGFNSFESGMRSVNIIEGDQPQPGSAVAQVMMDEQRHFGLYFDRIIALGLELGEKNLFLTTFGAAWHMPQL